MIEDKRHHDSLDTVLCQQELELPTEGLEFQAEIGIIHKIFSAVSDYITGGSIDWINHLEDIGGVAGNSTIASSTKYYCTIRPIKLLTIRIIMKAISYLAKFVEKIIQKLLMIINAIISLFIKCLKVDMKSHPSADLLNTYMPELIRDTGIMQELLESLIRNYRLR